MLAWAFSLFFLYRLLHPPAMLDICVRVASSQTPPSSHRSGSAFSSLSRDLSQVMALPNKHSCSFVPLALLCCCHISYARAAAPTISRRPRLPPALFFFTLLIHSALCARATLGLHVDQDELLRRSIHDIHLHTSVSSHQHILMLGAFCTFMPVLPIVVVVGTAGKKSLHASAFSLIAFCEHQHIRKRQQQIKRAKAHGFLAAGRGIGLPGGGHLRHGRHSQQHDLHPTLLLLSPLFLQTLSSVSWRNFSLYPLPPSFALQFRHEQNSHRQTRRTTRRRAVAAGALNTHY